jgi:hypothetical protein
MDANLVELRTALETAGIEFIDQNGDHPGVRLRRQSRQSLRGIEFIDENGGARECGYESGTRRRVKTFPTGGGDQIPYGSERT